ncbi:MFS transporter [Ramlibacter sp. 2FC]|uniref:MFS transporter n=1 Tax=Ramlibacter sp. 2FC TaxID=2502188 RepID=UPI0010F9FFE4|nr:MFS transporter [Ramlibacter sp. 2FC]
MGRRGNLGAEIAPAVLGQVCLHAAMAGARMSAPLLALSQGYGKGATGLLVALFAATQIFLSLPAGRYADRHGLKRPLMICVVAASIGVGLAAVWPVYPVLCVTALLCGGSVGAATIALQRHVGRAAESAAELKKAFSLLSIAPASANFVGPLLAGLLIDHAGFRAAFAALACLPVISWLLSRNAREFGANEKVPAGPPGTAWELMAQPGMRRLMFMNTLMTSSWDFHGFMVPVLGHERGISASAIGTILGSFAVAAALIRVSVPAIAARVREWVLITGAVALAGIVLLAYPFTLSPFTMAVCSALLGMALGSVQPMVLSMLHHMTPSHRQGEALAMRLIFTNASALTMPMLLGVAGGVVGASGVFWLMGTVVAAGSRVGFGLRDVHTE